MREHERCCIGADSVDEQRIAILQNSEDVLKSALTVAGTLGCCLTGLYEAASAVINIIDLPVPRRAERDCPLWT